MGIFYFDFEGQRVGIPAETLALAKEKVKAMNLSFTYTNDYEVTNPFEGQKILWVCSKPVDELPFLFKWGKKLALLLAYGTNCQCCLGYRILLALMLGSIGGYVVG